MVIGQNEIFSKANEAKEKTNMANIKEQIQMDLANKQALNEGYITDGDLDEILKKYGTINYEEDRKTIKGITTKEGNYEIAIEEIYNGKTEKEPENLAKKVITAQNYEDEVNYSANGVDSWKVFLNDGKNVYIIASDYVPRSGMVLGDGISAGNGDYCVIGDSQSNLLSWLTNSSMWTAYANGISGITGTATGGPILNQFLDSYNKKNSTNHSYTSNSDLSNEPGYSNTLYFPHNASWASCYAYWLLTPYPDGDRGLWRVACDGSLNIATYSHEAVGVRPLVCLPSDIYANKENGKWTFSK